MITGWDIYWITRLDSLNTLFVILPLICIGVILACCMFGDLAKGNIVHLRKTIVSSLIIGGLSVPIFIALPTTKQTVAIYMVPKIVNNEQVQKLPDNAMKFLNGKLEEWVKDMTQEKKKE